MSKVEYWLSCDTIRLLILRQKMFPKNYEDRTPTPSLAAEASANYRAISQDRELKRKKGQFFTPRPIAQFMSSMINLDGLDSEVTILDPGAGLGILSICLVEHLASKAGWINQIHIEAHETDTEVLPSLKNNLILLQETVISQGITLTFEVISNGFAEHVISLPKYGDIDIAISNPPYLKLSKENNLNLFEGKRSYPNAYALFMILTSERLKPLGQMVFITPRSFASGSYFKLFRLELLSSCSLNKIHSFISRSKAFKVEKVLQETVITVLEKNQIQNDSIQISHSSETADLYREAPLKLSAHLVIDHNADSIICIPRTTREVDVLVAIRKFTNNLNSLGLKASTGPVVSFRTKEFHMKAMSKNTMPFLWMNNVEPWKITWPKKILNRPQYFHSSAQKPLKVSLESLVLVRRFSTKDDKRRIIAAHLELANIGADQVAIENKLNYIIPINGETNNDLLRGVAAYLNSSLVDDYFRIINGNTNVSASELNQIPTPNIDQLEDLGRIINGSSSKDSIDKTTAFISSLLMKNG